MSNYKRKANYKSKRSCGLCKPWKRCGNSTHADNAFRYVPKQKHLQRELAEL